MSWRRLARARESFAEMHKPVGGAPLEPGQTLHLLPTRPPLLDGPSPPCTYFRRVHPFWMAIITASMGYYSWAVFAPATIPYDSLGPLGTFTRYLVKNYKACLNVGYGISWLIHIVETLYAFKLCRDKGITDGSTQLWWAGQTFLFGITSLSHLLNYDPLKEVKHQ